MELHAFGATDPPPLLASEQQLDDESARAVRASGNCTCDVCGKTYCKHPFTDHRDWNDDAYLNRLCDGRIVKL